MNVGLGDIDAAPICAKPLNDDARMRVDCLVRDKHARTKMKVICARHRVCHHLLIS